jgi:uncharacterized protein involved in exopolysaccharide biosynthesis
MQNEFDDFQENTGPESNIITELLQRYLPYWPIFVFTVLISMASAYLYLRYATFVYSVNAKVLVKDEKKGVDASKVLDALNLFGEKKIVENETEIIRSYPLTHQSIKNLNLYASQFHIGKFKNTELYGASAPLKIAALHKDSINPTKKPIVIKLDWARNGFVVNKIFYSFNRSLKINGQVYFIQANPDYLKKTLANPEKRENEISLDLRSVDALTTSYVRGLNVEASSKQSSVINVSLETSVPKKGEDFINTLISVYNEASVGDKNLVAKNTLAFVEARLKLVEKDLERVEENIKNFKTSSDIVDISSQGQLFLESVKENDVKLSEIKIQLSVLDDVETSYTIKTNQFFFSLLKLLNRKQQT